MKLFKELMKLPTLQEFASCPKKLPKRVYKDFKLPFLRRCFDPSEFHFSKKIVNEWNKSIDQLAKNAKVLSYLEHMYEFDVSIASFKLFLFQLITKIGDDRYSIRDTDIINLADHLLTDDDKVKLITGLSVLEICILIAIKHHCEIYDNDPFNFEMILTRYNKFAYKSSTMQNIDRGVVLKGFENLKVRNICRLKFEINFNLFHSIKNSSAPLELKEKFKRNIKCIKSSFLPIKLKEPSKNIITSPQK